MAVAFPGKTLTTSRHRCHARQMGRIANADVTNISQILRVVLAMVWLAPTGVISQMKEFTQIARW